MPLKRLQKPVAARRSRRLKNFKVGSIVQRPPEGEGVNGKRKHRARFADFLRGWKSVFSGPWFAPPRVTERVTMLLFYIGLEHPRYWQSGFTFIRSSRGRNCVLIISCGGTGDVGGCDTKYASQRLLCGIVLSDRTR